MSSKTKGLTYSDKITQVNDPSSKYYIEEIKYSIKINPILRVEMKEIEENSFAPYFVRNIDIIKNIRLRSSDTFIIGFPKSGTTWTEEIVWLNTFRLIISFKTSKQNFQKKFFKAFGK